MPGMLMSAASSVANIRGKNTHFHEKQMGGWKTRSFFSRNRGIIKKDVPTGTLSNFFPCLDIIVHIAQ